MSDDKTEEREEQQQDEEQEQKPSPQKLVERGRTFDAPGREKRG